MLFRSLVAADRMSQIPAVQKEIPEAEAEKRRRVDVPQRVMHGAVQRAGKRENLELRICAVTCQRNRVGVETTLEGIQRASS